MKGLSRGRAAFPSPPPNNTFLCNPLPRGLEVPTRDVNDLNFAEILPYCKGPSH